MKLDVREQQSVTIVDLDGNLTIGGGDVMLRNLTVQLLQNDRKQIVLNMAGVAYMDSAGIGELVACYKRAKEKDGTVKLLNPSGKVYDLLQLTKLEDVFDTFKNEQEAINSF